MSRALDLTIITTETQTAFTKIYQDIANILCPQPPVLIEIEILGKSHVLPDNANVLVDGDSVAIPKYKLVQAFIYARKLFLNELKPCPAGREDELLHCTAVMLLLDAEHLTAANARKRLILSCRSDGVKVAMKRELLFVNSFLTSRLHRHTKSPTLWSHRRWLLEQTQKAGGVCSLEDGLRVVLIAAERHPRNYYAWLHLRWLVTNASREEVQRCKLLDTVRDWAISHPADTSGFSFLIFLIEYNDENWKDTKLRSDVLTDVLTRTSSFNWTYESIWVFLRTLAASLEDRDQKQLFGDLAIRLLDERKDNVKDTRVLKEAITWVHDYSQYSTATT